MKKVIKIKESAVLGIINKIMLEQSPDFAPNEQTTGEKWGIPVSGEIGTYPTFDGFKTLLKTLKIKVEDQLREGKPFKVVNGGTKFSRSGNSLTITVSLEQCEEQERYWYFDLAGAVFSYATDDTSLRSALDNKLIDKARYFGGIANDKKHLLKTNFIDISTLKGIDPKAPEKAFKLLVGYVVGEMPEGIQTLPGDEPIDKAETNTVKQTAQQAQTGFPGTNRLKKGDVLIGIRSTDSQLYSLKIDTSRTYGDGDKYVGYPSVQITGPGSYEGNKLDGSTSWDLYTGTQKFNELSGNNEMGTFTITSYNGKKIGDVQATGQPATAQQAATPQTNTTQQNAGITKTLSGSFTTDNGDKAHNFKELEDKMEVALTEMYKKGTNPKIKSVTAKITNNGGSFSTSYSAEIGPSDDGKAWMGFTARGSYGKGKDKKGQTYDQRADGQISGTENEDGRSLEQKLQSIGAGEVEPIGEPYWDKNVPVKEYFYQFTKPQKYPPHK